MIKRANRTCPFDAIDATAFWSKLVANIDPSEFEPILKISRKGKIAAAVGGFARRSTNGGYPCFVIADVRSIAPEANAASFDDGVFSKGYRKNSTSVRNDFRPAAVSG